MRNYYLSLCLFLLSFPLYVEAQSPGGVDGVELWHMTVPMNTDLTGNYLGEVKGRAEVKRAHMLLGLYKFLSISTALFVQDS